MKLLNIGQIIRSERMKRGISQEDLVFDICTPATLSRLENNLHTPTRSIYMALLEKIEHLGYISYSTSENNIIFSNNTIYDLVFSTLDNKDFSNLECFIKDIKQYYEDETLIEQFITAIDCLQCSDCSDDVYQSIKGSILLTITSFNEDEQLDYILTNNEILLLYSLAIYYERNNNILKATNIMNNLLHCIEEYNSELNFSSCARLYKYAISLYIKDKQYSVAIDNIEKYIIYCKTHSIYNQIPDTACFETECKIHLGLDEPYTPVIDAYFYYLANKQEQKAEHIKSFCLDKLQITFTTLFK